eukprot:m.46514 g.46514  ORF g.46514 m.46514 type:complete len:358 (-) comp11140_c0_seq2:30-1103(-)
MSRARRWLLPAVIAALFLYLLSLSMPKGDPLEENLGSRSQNTPNTLAAAHTPAAQADKALLSQNTNTSINVNMRMVLATIPRSGNGWLRGLIEAAIGVGTLSVFPEEGAVYDARTQAYGPDCGWLGDCALVHAPREGDPLIVKTHFPFTTLDNKADLMRRGLSDAGAHVAYLFLPVRNVLDNHEAWVRYNRQRHGNASFPVSTLREFAAAWAEHHDFWFSLGAPCFTYRYEDLVDNPLAILVRMLKTSGLWARYALSETDLLRVSSVPRLQSYRRKQTGAQTRHRDDVFNSFKKYAPEDIQWVLTQHRELLARFGYDQLYEAWLAAAAGRYNTTELEAHVHRIMKMTAETATWGESL